MYLYGGPSHRCYYGVDIVPHRLIKDLTEVWRSTRSIITHHASRIIFGENHVGVSSGDLQCGVSSRKRRQTYKKPRVPSMPVYLIDLIHSTSAGSILDNLNVSDSLRALHTKTFEQITLAKSGL